MTSETDIKLTFLGAAQNVTGSRYLLQIHGKNILIDCGLYQERPLLGRNWDPLPIAPGQLDAMLLTHAHLDHCGLLPRMVQSGFQGPVICTKATAEIARIVLLDSAAIQEEDAQFKQKRHKREGRTPPRPVLPLYTKADAQACQGLFSPTPYDRPVELPGGVEATFYDAGHIFGAAMIMLNVKTNGARRRILFSGDVGRWDKPILRDPTTFAEADYVITESTYGDRCHEDNHHIKDTLAEIVNDTRAAGGNLIIPSFAIERTQEVLYYLNDLLREDRIPHLMVYMDSPMAISVTEVFEHHPELFDEEMAERVNNHQSFFDFPGLQMTRTTAQSKAINHITGTVLIIAGSGMCTGGRIKHHLVNNISRGECTILFVGYQAHGTLGRIILEGHNPVRILGQERPVKARIERITGFSAHADRDELFRWISALESAPRRVFVTHGESDAAHYYARFLHEKTAWPASVPSYEDTVTLD